MKNRKWLMVVSLVLALCMSLGGTLAYLTDTDEAVNIMTLGNVDIEQLENGKAEGGFAQGQPLYPAYIDANKNVTGAVEKEITVENTGASDAYVRTWIAFEAGNLTVDNFEETIHVVYGGKGYTLSEPQIVDIKGTNYYVVCATYTEALQPGEVTDPSLVKVYMDPLADNDDVAQFNGTYEILALTQAVQTANMEHLSPAEALNAGFGAGQPWTGDVAGLPSASAANADELKAAMANGGTVVLTADIEMDHNDQIVIPEGKAVVLELNGHDITGDLSKQTGDVHTALFTVTKGASLTINGEGNVHAVAYKEDDKVSSIITNTAGTVTINGGNYTMDYGTYNEGYLIPTIIDNNTTLGNATVTINGGTFIHTRNMFRNFANSNSSVAKIIINDGVFAADGDDGIGYIWNQKPSSSIINGGAGVVEINGGTFAGILLTDEFAGTEDPVTGENVETLTPVDTAAELAAAAKEGGKVLMTEDVEAPLTHGTIYGTPAAAIQKGGEINGNGNSLIIENPVYNGYAIETYGGTIKNLTIDSAVGRGIVISSPTENVYIDNVVVNGPGYTINTTEHNGKQLFVTNSTVKGWTSLAGLTSASFENCLFGENDGKYWQNYGYGQDYDRLIRAYVNITFTSCEFEQGYYIDTTVRGADCKVILDNCVCNGVKITAENYADYITVELPAGCTLDDCVIFK